MVGTLQYRTLNKDILYLLHIMLTALLQNEGEETVEKRKIYFELSKKFFEINNKSYNGQKRGSKTSEWMPRRRLRTLLHKSACGRQKTTCTKE
jgi:hypothetical protein